MVHWTDPESLLSDPIRRLCRSETETVALGEEIGHALQPGAVVLISGPLGAGKTRLAAGIARGLGCTEPVTSPTYTLINAYSARLPLYHLDCYRLNDPEELEDIGLAELIDGRSVCLVEWPEIGEDWWPTNSLRVLMRVLPDASRDVSIFGATDHATRALEKSND